MCVLNERGPGAVCGAPKQSSLLGENYANQLPGRACEPVTKNRSRTAAGPGPPTHGSRRTLEHDAGAQKAGNVWPAQLLHAGQRAPRMDDEVD